MLLAHRAVIFQVREQEYEQEYEEDSSVEGEFRQRSLSASSLQDEFETENEEREDV